ncbi:hypothetical protein CLV92_10130 [Kineococcus xinjiangensis]|uniref:Lipoprotein n=1 Tax=Kineococcus xinjiangensis TaxID=512762 RepID=A0A2S6IVL5_9ACTN|nr:hypothetical protein [Kineococcus xinjiangensis]PPK98335.1 hypothetical protein CLV92_10130 [Kineococcus xinjiangensis]
MGPLLRRLATAATAAALLTGCTTSPTTTYTDAAGREVTVDWADYPGHAGLDADDALAAPPQEEAERVADALLADLQAALAERHGLELAPHGDDAGWFPSGGNGYGGSSAYVTYNSAQRRTGDLPDDPRVWRGVVETVSEITREHGLGPVLLDHEQTGHAWQQDERRERERSSGTTDPDGFWAWDGVARDGAQWLSLDLTDVTRHVDPRRVEDRRELGLPLRSVVLFYGVTTIADEHRDTFRQRLEPFRGLERPAATHSG